MLSGCPMTAFEHPCYGSICPWFLVEREGDKRGWCAVARLADDGKARAPMVDTRLEERK